jgi:hypothetical protein
MGDLVDGRANISFFPIYLTQQRSRAVDVTSSYLVRGCCALCAAVCCVCCCVCCCVLCVLCAVCVTGPRGAGAARRPTSPVGRPSRSHRPRRSRSRRRLARRRTTAVPNTHSSKPNNNKHKNKTTTNTKTKQKQNKNKTKTKQKQNKNKTKTKTKQKQNKNKTKTKQKDNGFAILVRVQSLGASHNTFLSPFSAAAWGVILAALVFSALALCALDSVTRRARQAAKRRIHGAGAVAHRRYEHVQDHALEAVMAAVGSPSTPKAPSWAPKIVFVAWSFFCLIIVAAYTASLTASLTVCALFCALRCIAT